MVFVEHSIMTDDLDSTIMNTYKTCDTFFFLSHTDRYFSTEFGLIYVLNIT